MGFNMLRLSPVRTRQRLESYCRWRQWGWSFFQKTAGLSDPEQKTVPCKQANDDKNHCYSSWTWQKERVCEYECVPVCAHKPYPFSFHCCFEQCPRTKSADCLSAHKHIDTDQHVHKHMHTVTQRYLCMWSGVPCGHVMCMWEEENYTTESTYTCTAGRMKPNILTQMQYFITLVLEYI